MNMRIVATAALFVVAGANDVHADWLDNAWSDKSVATHGNPAITVRPDGVSVVLPAETLDEAYSEKGMNRKDALLAFLDRYSPQCSTILDLNTAQPNLTVELSIQGKTSLEDLSSTAEDRRWPSSNPPFSSSTRLTRSKSLAQPSIAPSAWVRSATRSSALSMPIE